jgi:AraC-like DNA-binding protein
MSNLGSFSDLFARRVGATPSDYQHRACTQNLFSAASA